jgi:crossover junction endodeoxyribonuclease RuvC
MSIIVAIDSGASGAVAIFDTDSNTLIDVRDLPVDHIQVGKSIRSRVSRWNLLELLRGAKGAEAIIERPEGRPLRYTDKATGRSASRTPGAQGMLSMGENFGCCLMALTAAEMIVTEVRPGVWKRALGVKAAKDDSRRRAQELFPAHAALFARVKDDGRSEAALLAYYHARQLRGMTHVAA